MKRFIEGLLVVAAVVLIGSVAYAGNTVDPGVQERIDNQQKRINQGIASGELTRVEADRLQDNLNRIKADEACLKADGRLTPRERARLQHELERESDRIYRKKHNPRRR